MAVAMARPPPPNSRGRPAPCDPALRSGPVSLTRGLRDLRRARKRASCSRGHLIRPAKLHWPYRRDGKASRRGLGWTGQPRRLLSSPDRFPGFATLRQLPDQCRGGGKARPWPVCASHSRHGGAADTGRRAGLLDPCTRKAPVSAMPLVSASLRCLPSQPAASARSRRRRAPAHPALRPAAAAATLPPQSPRQALTARAPNRSEPCDMACHAFRAAALSQHSS